MRKIIVGAFLITAIGQAALAGPKVKEGIRHYSISGNTVEELKASMKKNGPRGYWGYTEWYVKWSGSCKVSVDVKYTMPKLASPKKVPADVKAKFDRMYANLLAHEKNHGKNGISAAQQIEAANCVNGDAILKKHNALDVAYDKKTKHGLREGVKF
ncbi:DUF922 domain-containing protein [Neptunicoccus cionae]|uniref:DUF922 domain-containing protein n=1 Tax=Neptunicoccus cionae TaxID=2035344 RepID=UPI000C7943F0|nr:DUF922 domain-containing protein [Amylibacter cionae]PLS19919.1 hypothetical protein C0U40_19295 [Amylibacter cionae]